MASRRPLATRLIRRRWRLYTRLFIFFSLFALGAGFVFGRTQIEPLTQVAQATAYPTQPTPAQPEVQKAAANVTTSSLQTALQKVADAHPDIQLGISFVNLGTGEAASLNGETPFAAASTTKLLSAATYLHEVETGEASLDSLLGPYTAEFQLHQMINQSNNDSWDLVNNAVGFPAEEAYAKENGIGPFVSDENTWTPNGMAAFLQKLYNNQLLSSEHRDLLLSDMKDTNEESYLPASFPTSTVYHKYGYLDTELHDGGIVVSDTATYVVVVFTKGSDESSYTAQTGIFSEVATAIQNSL